MDHRQLVTMATMQRSMEEEVDPNPCTPLATRATAVAAAAAVVTVAVAQGRLDTTLNGSGQEVGVPRGMVVEEASVVVVVVVVVMVVVGAIV